MLSVDLIPWFDALTPFVGGTPCRPFLLLAGNRTLVGQHYLLRRFSCSSRQSNWSTLKKSQGREHLTSGDEIPGVFFFVVPGGPIKSVGGISFSVGGLVPGGLQ